MADGAIHPPKRTPFEPGELVHIRKSASEHLPNLYHHNHACEVVSVYSDYTGLDDVSCGDGGHWSYMYELEPVIKDKKLPALYNHADLVPSPRGYKHVDRLLGEQGGDGPTEWELELGKLMREDIEMINTLLSVVDLEDDEPKDWLRELKEGESARTTSIFAELLLLYHLRLELGQENVRTNATFGDSGKNVDVRATTNDWDVWLEVYKPDYVEKLGGFMDPEGTGTSMGNKLREKFDEDRQDIPEDAVVLLAVYIVEPITQGFQLQQWLDQEYFDLSEYCDGILLFSHFGFPTEFDYYPVTQIGEDYQSVFERMFEES